MIERNILGTHIKFPFEMSAKEVYESIHDSGWHCPSGNIFGGVQVSDTGLEVYP